MLVRTGQVAREKAFVLDQRATEAPGAEGASVPSGARYTVEESGGEGPDREAASSGGHPPATTGAHEPLATKDRTG